MAARPARGPGVRLVPRDGIGGWRCVSGGFHAHRHRAAQCQFFRQRQWPTRRCPDL